MKKIILYSGGVLNLILAVFHMFFWRLLNWKEALPKMSAENAGILQIANIIIIFLLLYFSAISFVMAGKQVLDFFAKSIIVLISGFYMIRLALGLPFFGFSIAEMMIEAVCLGIIICYMALIPLSGGRVAE